MSTTEQPAGMTVCSASEPQSETTTRLNGRRRRSDLNRQFGCGRSERKTISELRTRLLQHTMKPEEIAGDADTKHRRVVELVRWMVRYNEGNANPKWLAEHATELAHYVAELKGL